MSLKELLKKKKELDEKLKNINLTVEDIEKIEKEGIEIYKAFTDTSNCPFYNHKIECHNAGAWCHPDVIKIITCAYNGKSGKECSKICELYIKTKPKEKNEKEVFESDWSGGW